MIISIIIIYFLDFSLLFLSIVLGAEIQLIDGNTINGEIISNLDNQITIKTESTNSTAST